MNEALTEAWLQELWPTCREVSREERAVDRARNAVDTPSNTRAKAGPTWENTDEAARCANTERPLTRPSESAKGGLR